MAKAQTAEVVTAKASPPTRRRRKSEPKVPETPAAPEVAAPEAPATRGRLSGEHLEALAAGREEGRIVRRYLDATTFRPSGRHADPDFLRRKLKRLDAAIPAERDPLVRLGFIQQRITTLAEIAALREEPEDLGELEEMFIKVAKRYGERKGLSYQAWRSVGVTPDVLRRADIPRQLHS